ncbi:LysR family transcriptional regulator [Vibrio sp. SCSIO 43136]|uniref:LysR family transcriptional regulator n=1 Tax=Vibrio sp. SCSIO 43136 TaxID=2819101 RepID=UPI0020764B6C|nr:LysR family transcriptional regulator [Vibrio sp. SCSIO 43136]USD67295.1 LysR family transcriptional regulator [Vibrio sp. SCSIO 43136]
MSLNLDYLAAFVEVYEEGSFAKAAAKSHRHASTYSRKISALEDDLGFELFIRYSRSLEATEKAKALYDHAKAFLLEASAFDVKVEGIFQGHSGETVIVIDVAVIELGVMTAISELIKAMPSLKVTVKTGDTQSVRQALIDGSADMAFALTTYSLPAEVNSFRHMDFPLVRVATPEYMQRFGFSTDKPLTPSMIRSMTQVVMTPLRNLGVESQVYSHDIISADSLKVGMEMAKQSVAWCNLPESLAMQEINDEKLIQFEVEDDYDLSWSVELLWSTEKIFDPVRDRLIECLESK